MHTRHATQVGRAGPGVLRLVESQAKSGVGSDTDFFLAVNKLHSSSPFFKSVKKARRAVRARVRACVGAGAWG